MKLSAILRRPAAGHLSFWCPGCNDAHQILYGEGSGPRWSWNGSEDRPTFTPSVLVTWSEPSDDPALAGDQAHDIAKRCHSFVTAGQIQFLDDCSHALAGRTLPLHEFPSGWGES